MKKTALIVASIVAMLSLGGVGALAAEAEADVAETVAVESTASYSYLAGQQRSQSRVSLYAQAAELETEEEQAAFLAENGIGETAWSEGAAASYSYVAGQQRGASHRMA